MHTRRVTTWGWFFGVVAVAWTVAYFINLYFLSGAELDDWCYFAPGVAASRPLGIVAPLMGDFLGADRVWGFHWPGAPLLYSCLFAVVPWSPLLRVLLFMGMLAATVAVTFRLLRHYLEDTLLALAGATILLVDRLMFGMMTTARPEVLSTLVLTTLIWCLAVWRREPEIRWPLAVGAPCFFLLPLLHPVLLPLGGLLVAFVGWRGWQTRRLAAAGLFSVCYLGGLAAFASWFLLQPDALQQLRVNAAANAQPFGWGRTLFRHLGATQVLPTMFLLYALALAGAWAVWSFRPRSSGEAAPVAAVPAGDDRLLLPLTLLGTTAAAQLFPNPFYQIVVLPVAITLAILALRGILRRWLPAFSSPTGIALAVLAFTAVHGVFWPVRTFRYFQTGRPNLRGELRGLVQSLPADAQTVLIPDILWEVCLARPDRYVFYTLTFPCTTEMRAAYEDMVFARTRPGDLLLVNNRDLVHLSRPVPPETWEFVQRHEHALPSRSFWGYDVSIYRRR